MTANELRIGNWISDKSASDKCMWQVKELRVKLCFYGSFYGNYDSLKPIPLTPEILEKCGFVEVLNGDYYSHKMLSEKITLYLPYFNLDYYIGNVQVKYLHQLQNIYFALTGEELNINL